MRSSRALARLLAGLLVVLAALGWFEERRFIGRALRAEGHLAGIVEHEVRSLFGVDIELRPTVEFLARDGTLQRFEATVDIKRLGLGRDAPLGATLSAEVLYLESAPAQARLDLDGAQRGGVILLLAALGLLFAPPILARAFDRGADAAQP